MEKIQMKPGNLVYPVPAALVSCADKNGNTNILTVAWTGTICSDPVMLYISVRPERYSHHMISETKEFVLNLTTKKIARATDFCGVRSGKNIDKWKEAGLTPQNGQLVSAPIIKESPVNIECKVTEIKHLGSHDMFIAEVLCVDVDAELLDKDGQLDLDKAGLIAYSHGEYRDLGNVIGTFGYSVKKNSGKEKTKRDVSKKCGGCIYAGVKYDEQLKNKQKKIEKLLGEFGDVDAIIGMDNPLNYRNKVHHVFGHDKSGIISGSYVEGTHKIVNTDECLIEDKKSQKIIRTITELCKSFKIKTYDEDSGYGLLRQKCCMKMRLSWPG